MEGVRVKVVVETDEDPRRPTIVAFTIRDTCGIRAKVTFANAAAVPLEAWTQLRDAAALGGEHEIETCGSNGCVGVYTRESLVHFAVGLCGDDALVSVPAAACSEAFDLLCERMAALVASDEPRPGSPR